MGRAIHDLQQSFRRHGRERRFRERRPAVEALEERALLSAVPHLSAHAHDDARHAKKAVSGYQQTNLVSDLSSMSPQVVDTNLKNPWGMAFSSTSPFWISDQGSGVATIYSVNQSDVVTKASLTVTVLSPGTGAGSPTGQVANASTSDFLIPGPNGTKVPAVFIFDTLDGTIAGWNPGSTSGASTAVIVVNKGGSEQFTGLALGSSGGQNFLYAANDMSSPGIDV
jgi:uncharacterized protein (TIGR03118 family)